MNIFPRMENHGHGDDLVVKAIPETEYDVSVEVQFSDSTTEEEATEFLSQIEQFIRCAFREKYRLLRLCNSKHGHMLVSAFQSCPESFTVISPI